MPEQPINAPDSQTGAAKPLVLIPLTAEDVERARRRKLAVGGAAALAVLIAAWFLYQHIADPRAANEALDAGRALMKATRYEQAILNFDRAIDLNPKFAEAYRLRAQAYTAEYNPDAAIRDFTKVTELRPLDAKAFLERGMARLDKQDLANAIADATRAIEIDPKLARAYNLRATARRASGDHQGAIADFTKAVELDPNLDNYFQRGSTYQLIGEHRLAVADFTQAIEFDPQQPALYFARAKSRSAMGDAEGAKQDVQAGRKIDGW
jgi:tetratricopeptide (TPR) repeat protein